MLLNGWSFGGFVCLPMPKTWGVTPVHGISTIFSRQFLNVAFYNHNCLQFFKSKISAIYLSLDKIAILQSCSLFLLLQRQKNHMFKHIFQYQNLAPEFQMQNWQTKPCEYFSHSIPIIQQWPMYITKSDIKSSQNFPYCSLAGLGVPKILIDIGPVYFTACK